MRMVERLLNGSYSGAAALSDAVGLAGLVVLLGAAFAAAGSM